MSIYKRGEIWWAYIVVSGEKIRQSLGTTDKKQAQAEHDKLKVSFNRLTKNGKTTDDAITLWLDAKPRSDRSKSELRIFREAYQARPLIEVTGFDILDALADKSPANYNKITNNIRAAFKLAEIRKWCEHINIPKRKVDTVKLRFLSNSEWNRLYNALPAHIKPMALFAISTGIRQSNVFNLQWSNVDIERKTAWIDATEAKGKKSISIPLSDNAISALESQIDKHKHYVFTYQDNPVKSVKTAYNKALVKANIDVIKTGVDKNGKDILKSTFRWHDLRHTWASWHVQNGTPLLVLKELGGWASVEMVQKYAHLSPEHLKVYANNSVS